MGKVIKSVTPINNMVLINHDKDADRTAGGILLPDNSHIPVLTGIIAAMPEAMKENHHEYPFSEGDRVVYDIRDRVPYNFDPHNNYYLVDARRILGIVHEEEI